MLIFPPHCWVIVGVQRETGCRAPSLVPELWWLQRNVLMLQPLPWGHVPSPIYIFIYVCMYACIYLNR